MNVNDKNYLLYEDNYPESEKIQGHNQERIHHSETMPKRLCRLCAKTTGEMMYIFNSGTSEKSLAYKINACLPITVKITDPLPKQLCTSCVEQLNFVYDFSEGCANAEDRLNSHAKGNFFRSKLTLVADEHADKSYFYKNSSICIANKTEEDEFIYKENINDPLQNSCLNLGAVMSSTINFNNEKRELDSMISNMWSNVDVFAKSSSDSSIIGSTLYSKMNIPANVKTHNSNTLMDTGHQVGKLYKVNKIYCPLCIKGLMKMKNQNTYNNHNEKELEDINENVKKPLLPFENKSACSDEGFQDGSTFKNKTNDTHVADVQELNKYNYLSENSSFAITFPTENECLKHSADGSFPHSICGTRNETLDHINSHISSNIHASQVESTNSSFKHIYKCDVCVKYFASEETLQSHHNNFHSGSPIFCEICNKCCKTPVEYFDHIKNNHARNDQSYEQQIHEGALNKNICCFICEHCGKYFLNSQMLQEHYKSHQVVESIKCDLCEFNVNNREFLQIHVLLTHSETVQTQSCIMCSVCEEVFTQMNDAVNHISSHNGKIGILQDVKITAIYKCEYCEKCYATKSVLKIHYDNHKGNKNYICNICNVLFYNSIQVENHKIIHHSSNLPNTEEITIPKIFVCFECDICFLNWNTVCKHKELHNEKKKNYSENQTQFQERYRNETGNALQDKTNRDNLLIHDISTKTYLIPHSKLHKGKVYICNICGDTFRLKNLIEKHIKKHTNERPYFCDICGRTFNHKSGLYTHRRMHTGEKPYICDICEKTFRLKHDRDNHRRCHTGERPFKCEYCDKAFRTSHDHHQHVLIHTGLRPYVCSDCGKSFRRINGLNVHKRIHTGEKPYGCDVCGRHFTQKGDMLKHRKSQHRVI